MAIHRGATVMYVTNNGAVPAITTAHYAVSVVAGATDTAASGAAFVDLVTIGYSGTRVTGVALSVTAGTFTNRAAHTAGKYYVPS